VTRFVSSNGRTLLAKSGLAVCSRGAWAWQARFTQPVGFPHRRLGRRWSGGADFVNSVRSFDEVVQTAMIRLRPAYASERYPGGNRKRTFADARWGRLCANPGRCNANWRRQTADVQGASQGVASSGRAIRTKSRSERRQLCKLAFRLSFGQSWICSLMSPGRPSAARSKAAMLSLNGKVALISCLRSTLPDAIMASARSNTLA
jgi:hypothetical protein